MGEAENKDGDLLSGLVTGAIAGLVGTWTMTLFQTLWSDLSQPRRSEQEQSESEQGKGEPATVKAARRISEDVFDHRLTEAEKGTAGNVVHYAMGSGSAAVYGAAAELFPRVTLGDGTAFGAMVWLIADEAVVPAVGLAKSPAEFPFSTHLYGLVSHLVYGLSTEAVRRVLRAR